MKLSPKVAALVSDDLIVRINELYHDLENELYQDRQGGWIAQESKEFCAFARPYIKHVRPVVCLDYGSGTGFVPLAIGAKLNAEDTLICTDLSSEILNVCRRNLKNKDYPFHAEYRKMDGSTIPVEDQSLDVLTVNAVLHHVFNLKQMGEECARVLKPGGALVISHEPNGDREMSAWGNIIYGVSQIAFRPSFVVFRFVEKSSILEVILRSVLSRISSSYHARNLMLENIAKTLMKEGLLNFPLRGVEIQQLVDVHTETGFRQEDLMQNVFPDFEIEQWQTFNHLGDCTEKSSFTRRIDSFMALRWPMHGKTLRFVLQRKTG